MCAILWAVSQLLVRGDESPLDEDRLEKARNEVIRLIGEMDQCFARARELGQRVIKASREMKAAGYQMPGTLERDLQQAARLFCDDEHRDDGHRDEKLGGDTLQDDASGEG